MKGDSNIALGFLQRWAPEGPWTLNAIDPEKKQNLIAQTFDLSNTKEALAFIEHWNGKRNLYFMVNRSREYMNTKAKKEHIGWLIALHVDLDPPPPPKGADAETAAAHYEAARALLLEKLQSYAPVPSVIIASGGGYGAFWLLREAVEIDNNAEHYELFNKKIEADLQGDHCHNLDRIMRLPGTVNIPNAKKIAAGRVESLSYILKDDWDRLYGLESFALFEEEKKAKQRKPKGSGSKKTADKNDDDWVERVLQNGPDHEGPRSYDNDRSKAMWAVCCALVRRNWTVDEITEALLNKANKLSEHVYDQNGPEKYARKQATKAFDEAMGDFTFNELGKPHPTQENVRVALKMLECRLMYDEFSDRAYIEGPDGLPRRRIGDRELNGIYLRIARDFGFRPAIDLFKMMIEDDAYANVFHPVKEYLDSLKWDGEKRIDEWLVKYAGAPDNEFVRRVSAICLIAGVRRIKQPGCKYDEIIVLEGEQGTDKSTALRVLAHNPDWFTDSFPFNAKDKEIIEQLQGKWIVESPELKGMKGSSIEHHKAMLSRQVDRARLSYGRFITEVPRHSTFYGSTNSKSYLGDTTGNRRFWPMALKRFDIPGLSAVVDQLWAEAASREAAGESIRLPEHLWDHAELEQKRREIDDPWEGSIMRSLNGYNNGKILSADLWDLIDMKLEKREQRHNERLGDIMRGLGWERKKLRFGGKYGEWCYAKGDKFEQGGRIFITRDSDGVLKVEKDGEGMAKLDEGEEEVSENNGGLALERWEE